jgi:large subunit ribosomal protein L19
MSMNKNLAKEISATQLRKDLPDFVTGDTVKVSVRIIENGKSRIQVFEGLVIAIRGGGVNKTFVVRKTSDGVGVERNFPYCSPLVAAVTVVKHGKVRRKKIYYQRNLAGKDARLTEIFKNKEDKAAAAAKPEEKPAEAKPVEAAPAEKPAEAPEAAPADKPAESK